jgi:hypothetical protein
MRSMDLAVTQLVGNTGFGRAFDEARRIAAGDGLQPAASALQGGSATRSNR